VHRFRLYNEPKQFWNDVSPFLLREETKNNLCLGICHQFLTDSAPCVYQSALFDRGELLGALVLRRFMGTMRLMPTPLKRPDFAQRLLEEFRGSGLVANDLVAERSTAEIYRTLFEKAGVKISRQMAQGIYRCRSVKMPPPRESVRLRLAEWADIKQIAQWLEEFRLEAVPHDPPYGMAVAEQKVINRQAFLLEEGSEPVTMIGTSRDIGTSCSVNMVYTPKPHRKKGYASLATALLTKALLDSGHKETSLFTDMTNPTSNKIYRDVGYEFVCDSVHMLLALP
jgi:uncharacterized protein